MNEQTTIAIIGAGVSGLTLATFLQQAGIPCIIVERRDRAYIETRQRAGVVEARGVQMFERRGLADQLLGGPVAYTIDYRVNGTGRIFEAKGDDGTPGRFCTQQMLVNNLLKQFDNIRWNVTDIQIQHEEGKLTYTDPDGLHTITCDYMVGCDGDRGVSRSAIPSGVLTKYSYEFGYAWLAAHVEAPVTGHPIMGVSDHGFVAQLPRGPQRSRYYLQCSLNDGPEDWSDERFWDEVRLRLCDDSIKNVTVIDKLFVPLRSVVYAPMQYGKLFLAGDAAHLVPPTGAKGMNLALYDVDVLAAAFVQAVQHRDLTALDNYSDTCLSHIWTYQDFSVWMTETMHDAGDPALHGPFRQMIARARLNTLFSSTAAAHLHSEYQRGMI